MFFFGKIFTLALVFTITHAISNDAKNHPKLKQNEHTFGDDDNDDEKAINPPLPLLSLPPPIMLYSENNQRIINGNEAVPHSRPFQAGLIIRRMRNGFETQHICGGSVLSKNIILSTGFCIEHSHSTTVILGAHRLFENEITQQRFTLSTNEYIFHPGYDSSCMCNDIALLRLPESAVFNVFVQPIDLPMENTIGKSLVGAVTDVAGNIFFVVEF